VSEQGPDPSPSQADAANPELRSVKVYHGDAGYAALLQDSAVHMIDIVTPPDATIGLVEQALKAGKHVMSEKPIAISAAKGRPLYDEYVRHYAPHGQIWAVLENYRFEVAFCQAHEIIASGALGALQHCELVVHSPMDAKNQFFDTDWRKNPRHWGAYLLDGGVHFVAALKRVLNSRAQKVTGYSQRLSSDLPPPDTVSGVALMESGVMANIQISFASKRRKFLLHVTGVAGEVTITRGSRDDKHGYLLEHVTYGADSSSDNSSTNFFAFAGVLTEMLAVVWKMAPEAFDDAKAAAMQELYVQLSPELALDDVEFIHALL
jgi:predicted dehydrogenase